MESLKAWALAVLSLAFLGTVIYYTLPARMEERRLACLAVNDPYAPQPQLIPGLLAWSCNHGWKP